VPAVAVSNARRANLWVAAYALLLILIFADIARLIKDATIAYFPLSATDGGSGGWRRQQLQHRRRRWRRQPTRNLSGIRQHLLTRCQS
jgi:hypothetical protein